MARVCSKPSSPKNRFLACFKSQCPFLHENERETYNKRVHNDALQCLAETGADAVMSATGLLSNPSLFKSDEVPFIGKESSDLIHAYVKLKGGASISSIKGHLFRLWAPAFPRYPQFRARLDDLGSIDEIKEWNSDMSRTCGIKCEPYDREKHKISADTKVFFSH